MAKFDDVQDETHAVAPSFAVPADGWATLEIVGSGDSDTRDGKGKLAWFQVRVNEHGDADSVGREFRYMAIYKHVDEKKLGGGLHNLLQISKAVGFDTYVGKDQDEYHFQPFRGKLAITPQKDDKTRFNVNIREWGFENPDETEAPKAGGVTARAPISSKPNAANSAASKPAGGGSDWRSKAKQNA